MWKTVENNKEKLSQITGWVDSLSEVLVIKIGKLDSDENAKNDSEKSEWKESEREENCFWKISCEISLYRFYIDKAELP